MGRDRINAVLERLQAAGIRAQRGFPPGKMPHLNSSMVGVCIDSMDQSSTTLALHVYTPLHQGGAVCEDVALQVVEALATIYGTYKIQHCSFDSQTSLFHSTVLVTFQQARAE